MASGNFTIRRAASADLQNLLALYRHINSTDRELAPELAQDRFSAILAQPGMTVFIGFIDEIAASTVTLIVIPNLTRNGASYALIENVVTHAGHRKQGYAGKIIRHAIAQAWEAGCYKVMLLTGSKDPATLRFYENCGFLQDKTGYQIRRQS
ncbi:GNAT superfamily N-acetyltransferase [Rhizobium sp. BK650]|nr:GNAT family N-acetyltransferase [Rhizobium sp. BK650]MBB3655191.1 GNAT superfamily N-acetyltransferase [Rhizobium sp. BK650]